MLYPSQIFRHYQLNWLVIIAWRLRITDSLFLWYTSIVNNYYITMHHKRLKVEASHLPRTVINAVGTMSTVLTTPPAAAQQQAVPLPAAAPTTAAARRGGVSRPEEKIQAILDRYGKTFCEEMGVSLT